MYLTFLTVAKYARAFQSPHTQKSMGVRSGERGGCTSKTKYGNILTWNFFLVLVWRITHEVCPSSLDTPYLSRILFIFK